MDTCYLCGKSIDPADWTRDHVPPKALFPTPRPSNLTTLPAHRQCNKAYSADEERFRDDIIAIADHSMGEAAKEVWATVRRSMKRAPGKRREMAGRLKRAEIRTPAGIIVGPADALLLPFQRTDRVMIKIGKGLHAQFAGAPPAETLPAHAFFQPTVDATTRSVIERATHSVDFGEVFVAAGVFTDERGSFWGMSFFRTACAVVAFVSD